MPGKKETLQSQVRMTPWVRRHRQRQAWRDPAEGAPPVTRYLLDEVAAPPGSSPIFCTRQLFKSATHTVSSFGQARPCGQLNCPTSRPDWPIIPRILPSSVIL